MDITKQLIETNGGLLASLLIYKEFNFEQAVRFLPPAMRAVVELVSHEGIVQLPSSEGSIFIIKLMQKIDINLLAVTTWSSAKDTASFPKNYFTKLLS